MKVEKKINTSDAHSVDPSQVPGLMPCLTLKGSSKPVGGPFLLILVHLWRPPHALWFYPGVQMGVPLRPLVCPRELANANPVRICKLSGEGITHDKTILEKALALGL